MPQKQPTNSVIETLKFLGYDEVRLQGGRWKPLSEVRGALGTTEQTHVIQEDDPPRIRLRDGKTGEEIGRARKEPAGHSETPTREEEHASENIRS